MGDKKAEVKIFVPESITQKAVFLNNCQFIITPTFNSPRDRRRVGDQLEEESDLVVFMYREDNRMDEAILYTMNDLDLALDEKAIKMVSIDEKMIEKQYGLHGTPLLVHFNGNIPRVFGGDLAEEEEFNTFILESLEKSDIEEVNGDVLDSLISRLPNLAAVFYNSDDEKNVKIMEELENILVSMKRPYYDHNG